MRVLLPAAFMPPGGYSARADAAGSCIAKIWWQAKNIPLRVVNLKVLYEIQLKIKNEYNAVGLKTYVLYDEIKIDHQNLMRLSL
jgi:hypothetical protein